MPPVPCDPKETFELSLLADAGQAPETRATFIFHHLTVREWRSINNLGERVRKMEIADGDEACRALFDSVVAAIAAQLAGWGGVIGRDGLPVPFDRAKIEDVLGIRQVCEILFRLPDGGKAKADDLKKSESQSPSGTDSSARAAVQPTV